MSFSERQGLKQPRLLQTDSIDDALRNRLWNVVRDILPAYQEGYDFGLSSNSYIKRFSETLWHDYFKWTVDSMPGRPSQAIAQIRGYYFACPWNEVYDFIEFVLPQTSGAHDLDSSTRRVNKVLESELSAYRIVAGRFVPISSKQEAQAVEKAI